MQKNKLQQISSLRHGVDCSAQYFMLGVVLGGDDRDKIDCETICQTVDALIQEKIGENKNSKTGAFVAVGTPIDFDKYELGVKDFLLLETSCNLFKISPEPEINFDPELVESNPAPEQEQETVESTAPETEVAAPTETESEVVETTETETENVESTEPESETVEPTAPETEVAAPTETEAENVEPTEPEAEVVAPTETESEVVETTETKTENVESTAPESETVEPTEPEAETVESTAPESETVEPTKPEAETVESTAPETETADFYVYGKIDEAEL